ncbi:tetratricopeptide repeat protein [Streptomyces sp. NBC_00562]|uniref:tetratricopeptide repeat protein n=1 Tax=Streptomyces sp. NBC_00562 TaxID=2975777 RepID=UPI002E81BA6D|nr:tetratricopeptide repeat protein [Streptomyces sp. NBC_00562]WUC22241.1 tetratricopeptide repeat protein [Streptomyces sp. NBC_00562]
MTHTTPIREYFNGHAEQEGRVFQLGSGFQINTENVNLADLSKSATLSLGAQFSPMRISSVDPLDLGVHRSENRHDGKLPEYIPRTVDAELQRRVIRASHHGGFVLLVGDSTAGKTRSAFEALASCCPDAAVWSPLDGQDLISHLKDLVEVQDRCFLWLDDLERYIGPEGITPAVTNLLKQFKIPVVATMRAEQYRRLSPTGRNGNEDNHEHGHHALGSRVLQQLDPLILQRIWDGPELMRARNAGDSRITSAVDHSDLFGVAEYLAAGPRLYQEWELAWGAEGNPRGAALVAAAVDCARAGLTTEVPLSLLVELHEVYLERAGGDLLRPEPLDIALDWASSRRYGVTSFLLPIKAGARYRVFDYLPDAISRHETAQPVPAQTWESVLVHAVPEGLSFHVGMAAVQYQEWSVAERAWSEALDRNPIPARVNLGRVYVRTDRKERAKQVWKEAVDLGSIDASVYLGGLYEKEGNTQEAIDLYTIGAEKDDAHSIQHLAYAIPDDNESATWWLRVASSDETGRSAYNLGQCYARLGDIESAKKWWRTAAEIGYSHAMNNYGLQLRKEGKEAEGLHWLEKASDSGNSKGMGNWAGYLFTKERKEEALVLLHRSIELGEMDSLAKLGYLYMQEGDATQAEEFWRRGFEAGNALCAYNLGVRLEESGDQSGAEDAYRLASCGSITPAARSLAFMLVENGDAEEAEIYFRYALDEVDGPHICNFGYRMLKRGYVARSLHWLHLAFLRGHSHSAALAGYIVHCYGYTSDGERLLKLAASDGYKDAKDTLVKILVKEGRGAEAADVMRAFKAREGKSSNSSRGRGARTKRKRRKRK